MGPDTPAKYLHLAIDFKLRATVFSGLQQLVTAIPDVTDTGRTGCTKGHLRPQDMYVALRFYLPDLS